MGATQLQKTEIVLITKKSDQTINNQTTLVDITELKATLKPNTRYMALFRGRLISPNTADMDLTFKAIPGTLYAEFNESIGVTIRDVTNFGTEETFAMTGNIKGCSISAWIETGPAGGILQPQFGQNVPIVGDTSVLKDSILVLYELD